MASQDLVPFSVTATGNYRSEMQNVAFADASGAIGRYFKLGARYRFQEVGRSENGR